MDKSSHKALIVSSFVKFYDTIKPLAEKSGFTDTVFASGSDEAKRIIITDPLISAVIVNCPLKEGFGLDFALETAEKCPGVMVVVSRELFQQVSEKTVSAGVLTVMKPTSSEIMLQSLCLLKASSEKLLTYKKENTELQNAVHEIKLHARAKMLLIENLGMTEPQAHKYIEQRAMDSRLSKATVAENIIKSYGN